MRLFRYWVKSLDFSRTILKNYLRMKITLMLYNHFSFNSRYRVIFLPHCFILYYIFKTNLTRYFCKNWSHMRIPLDNCPINSDFFVIFYQYHCSKRHNMFFNLTAFIINYNNFSITTKSNVFSFWIFYHIQAITIINPTRSPHSYF